MRQFIYISTAIAFFFLSVFPSPGFAFDVNVVQGNATVTTNGNTVTIMATGKAILQGNTSIPAGFTVNVIQGINDILLRDSTGSATSILGSLFSNGNIILINTMGIYIGRSANINVGGLIASTLDMKNDLFMNGNYQFEKIPGLDPAEILNKANIKIANGGYLILLADRVVNKGTITAYMGTVALGSGQEATVSFDQGGLINLVINKGLAQELTGKDGKDKAQIVNSGKIYTDGGKIQMTAELLQTSLKQIINNTGIIEADNVLDHGGLVELTSSGAIDNTGTIKAGTLKEQGETFHSTGTLDVGHGYFNNLDGAINISGNISGSYSDTGDIDLTGAVTLTGDTTLQADDDDNGSGEIVMNGNSLTGGGFNLTLTAGQNDTLDGSITGVNLLTLNSSTASNNTFISTGTSFSVDTLQTNFHSLFSRSQGSGTSGDPYMIYSDSNAAGGLQYIQTEGLSADYQLANNINAAETSSWAGGGFSPLGTFTGTFNGNNFTISHLFIDLPSVNEVGLFGSTSGATIKNVGLTSVSITGANYVGGLVGYNSSGSSIDNSYVTGTVGGTKYIGGLVGYNDSSAINNTYSTASVTGSSYGTGGLVGYNYASTIDNSYATGTVSGANNAGGLVGGNYNSSSIDNSYATGNVGGSSGIGGLAGFNYGSSSITNSYATGNASGPGLSVGGLVGFSEFSSSITNSYATGIVNGGGGGDWDGGLVGKNSNSSSITNSYATGSVSGNTNVGGFVGYNKASGLIDNSYSTGNVTGGTNVGGLVGLNTGSTVTNSYYSGTPDAGQGTFEAGGPSVFYSTSQAVYTGNPAWDFNGLWSATATYPVLVWQGMNNASFTGGTSAFPFLVNNVNQLQFMEYEPDASFQLASNIDASATSGWNAGDGFVPVGTFTGTFNGDDHAISDLFIDRSSTNDVGLFGSTSGATIENTGLAGVNITGDADVGGLVGLNNSSSITNAYVTGGVSGSGNEVGGLVGSNNSSSITNTYATDSVAGSADVGGLVGLNNSSSSIVNSFAAGNASGSSDVGGLVGDNVSSTVTNSYYSGSPESGPGTFESSSSVFYDPNFAVYTATDPWDFTNTWVANYSAYPLLLNTYDIWSASGSGNWSNAANWSMDAVPTSTTNVLFNATSSSNSVVNAFGGDIGDLVITSGYTGTITQSNALTMSGSYAQSGGTFDQNADLSIGGSYTHTGGAFNAGSQPVTFTGAGTITSGNSSFDNLTIDATGTYTVTDGITVTGNFIQTNGTFIADPTDTTFSVAGSFSLQGGEFNRFTGSGTGADPYLIYDIYGFQGMGGFLSSSFSLHNNIDASVTSTWNSGAGFTPVGNSATPFSGSFSGNIYTISGLFIDLPGTSDVGLFGKTNGAVIGNTGLADVTITGNADVGGLVGSNNNSSISGSYVTGSVSASGNDVGGLVGSNNNSGSITNTYSTATVSEGGNNAGGLVGLNNSNSSIDNSYATGSASTSGNDAGGLVGLNNSNSSIDNSYATGSASASTDAGGLAGSNPSGTITSSYYTNASDQNGLGTFESGGPGIFFNTSNPVYKGDTPWDFNNIWVALNNAYPVLRFNYIFPSSSLLTPQQQEEALIGTPSEITGQNLYDSNNALIEEPAAVVECVGGHADQPCWVPFNDAGQAVQEPWGMELK